MLILRKAFMLSIMKCVKALCSVVRQFLGFVVSSSSGSKEVIPLASLSGIVCGFFIIMLWRNVGKLVCVYKHIELIVWDLVHTWLTSIYWTLLTCQASPSLISSCIWSSISSIFSILSVNPRSNTNVFQFVYLKLFSELQYFKSLGWRTSMMSFLIYL